MATKSNISVPKNTDAYGISVVGVNQRISNTASSSVFRTKEVAGKFNSLYNQWRKRNLVRSDVLQGLRGPFDLHVEEDHSGGIAAESAFSKSIDNILRFNMGIGRMHTK
jgi:hypothetical protein